MRWIGNLVLLVFSCNGENIELDGLYPFGDDFIGALEKQNSTWKSGRNFEEVMNETSLSYLTGVLPDVDLYLPPLRKESEKDLYYSGPLPTEFDAREKWPHCPTIGEVRDQGPCGSCWAIAAVQVMTDRICIHSDGEINTYLSVQDLLTCCGRMCGFDCSGGYPPAAFAHWTNNGIVSGGMYGSKEGCKPYMVEPCKRHDNNSKEAIACKKRPFNNTCTSTCDGGSNHNYKDDKHYGKQYYSVEKDEEAIKRELFTNGPAAASFTVFADFFHYKSGVYQNVAGKLVGGHAVKLIGWGVENDTCYWLAVNSWSYKWGDNGYFKILRGKNHVNFEQRVITGLPKFKENEKEKEEKFYDE